MPESRIELTRRGFQVFNEGGGEAYIEFLAEEGLLDSEMVFYIQEDMPNAGEWKGVDGFIDANRIWNEAWDEFRADPMEVTSPAKNRVLARVEQRAVAKGSGMEITGTSFFYLFVFRAGKLAEMHLFGDRDRAMEAAGAGD
jgi:ketosteroid isomerase-like protein